MSRIHTALSSDELARLREQAARRAASYASPWRIAARAVALAAAIALLGLAAAVFAVPRLLGGDSLTVLSGSMQPTLNPGDVVAVRGIDAADVCAEVSVGQIVTYLPTPNDPALITHRVIAKTVGSFDDGTDCRLTTQGDANDTADAPVSPLQVRGVFLYGIPWLGWARQWVADNTLLVLGILAVVVVGSLAWSGLRPARTRVVAVIEHAPVERGPGLREAGERETGEREAEKPDG